LPNSLAIYQKLVKPLDIPEILFIATKTFIKKAEKKL
jgi:hypothetical protein